MLFPLNLVNQIFSMRLKTFSQKDSNVSDISLKILTFIAGNEDYLGRFMALTGIAPADLKSQLEDLDFHAAILDFALQDESLLLACAADQNIKPEDFMKARAKLPGFSQ